MFAVSAIITSKSGHEDKIREALIRLAKDTHQEVGCVTYHCYENKEKLGQFVMVEAFKDQAAFDAHMDAQHTKDYFDTYSPFFDIEVRSQLNQVF